MRAIRDTQTRLTEANLNSSQVRELKGISDILDANPRIYDLVHSDLSQNVAPDKGARGLSAEQVLRAFVIKQMEGFSYNDLAHYICDSSSLRWFCHLEWGEKVSKSALQRDIKKIRHETLEQINRVIVIYAKEQGLENGRKVRTDCTAVETMIHEPSDSTLLFDGVRTLTHLMKQARKEVPQVRYSEHTRRAKRRAYGIQNAKNMEQRRPLYKDLLITTRKTVEYAKAAVATLKQTGTMAALAMSATLCHFLDLTEKVISQTQRRVFEGLSVPAQDKVVSIFESHTDIIAKGKQTPVFGHKICLTGGASGLILDAMILDGNPADATLTIEMMERVIDIYGQAPRQATFDGAFSSLQNLGVIKELGVQDVVFAKSRGIEVEDMASSRRVYRALRHFRAGIEATISFLKRVFGLDRCTWRGWNSFKSYVWGSILSANLLVVARRAAEQ